MTNADTQEPVALKPCPFCGSQNLSLHDSISKYVECGDCHVEGPWNDDYVEDAIAAWNTRPASDLAERIEGLVEEWSEDRLQDELRLLYNHVEDDSRQFTRWNMHVAITHGISLAANALKEVNSHDRT